MSTELEVLKQRITELEAKSVKLEAENVELRKENAEISYLRNKLSVSDAEIAELKRRNIEFLRANEEYNERRDADNAKLRAENVEFRDRLTKVEQKQTLNEPRGASHNSFNICSSNFNSVADQAPTVIHHEKALVDTLLPEDKETDAFLDEVHKKKVSNEIRQRNREKKLLRKSSTKDLSGNVFTKVNPTSSVTQDRESRSHKKKEAENIVQDIFDFTMDGSEKNHMTEISLTGCEENNCQEKIESQGCLAELACSDVLQNINRLYENACTAENERVKANQAEILC
jgi:hypothetical protein